MLPKFGSSLLSSALLACMLAQHAFCGGPAKFYAYEVGLEQDRETGKMTRARTPIAMDTFYRVCYPMNPATKSNKKMYPNGSWKNKDLYKRWFWVNYIALVNGDEECPPGWFQEFDPIENESSIDVTPALTRRLRRHLHDPTVLTTGGNWFWYHEYSLGYTHLDDYDWFNDDEGFTLELFAGFPHNWNHYWKRVAFRFEARALPYGPQNWERQLLFNSDVKMGKAHDFRDEYGRRRDRTEFVDWHLDRNMVPDYDLVACEESITPHRVLGIISRDEILRNRNCIRIMLTTSSNQLEHIVDTWNERQKMWDLFKIPYISQPKYQSNYILTEQGNGLPPTIALRSDPNVPITEFPNGRQPVPQSLDSNNIPANALKEINMDRETPDELTRRAANDERVPVDTDDDETGDEDDEDQRGGGGGGGGGGNGGNNDDSDGNDDETDMSGGNGGDQGGLGENLGGPGGNIQARIFDSEPDGENNAEVGANGNGNDGQTMHMEVEFEPAQQEPAHPGPFQRLGAADPGVEQDESSDGESDDGESSDDEPPVRKMGVFNPVPGYQGENMLDQFPRGVVGGNQGNIGNNVDMYDSEEDVEDEAGDDEEEDLENE